MKALFVNIYGVLNNYALWNDDVDKYTFDSVALSAIKSIVDKTGASIYLIGLWREFWNKDDARCTKEGIFLKEAFASFGLTIKDKIKMHATKNFDREFEFFFFEHPEVDSYAIIVPPMQLYRKFRSNYVEIGDNGFTSEHIDKAIDLLNTPVKINVPNIAPLSYKIVLDDYILPMSERDWEIESKYEGRFEYRTVVGEFGNNEIIRIDKIELDEQYKDVVLKAELYAAKMFTGDENFYYRAYMDQEKRLMSYAFVCDVYCLYYNYKAEGFKMQGYEWIPHLELNPNH